MVPSMKEKDTCPNTIPVEDMKDLMDKIFAESYSGTFSDDVCLVGIKVQETNTR